MFLLVCCCHLAGLSGAHPADRDPLRVSIQPQDISPTTGAQRVVVWVENTSEKTFNGRLFFELRNSEDELIDFSSLDIEDLAPGRKFYEIAWFQFPSRVGAYMYRYGGTFIDSHPRRDSLEYEEMGREGGPTYMTFSIYTPHHTKEEIEQIVDIYKKKYRDLHGMNIRFYGESGPLVGDVQQAEGTAGRQTASYTLIRAKDFENLSILR